MVLKGLNRTNIYTLFFWTVAALRLSQDIHLNTFNLQKKKINKYNNNNNNNNRTTLIFAKLMICDWFHSTPPKTRT